MPVYNFQEKREFVLRINEAYEHTSILPYQGEECCQTGVCNKTSTQCLDVTAALTLVPEASVGTVTVACQGTPTITCVTAPDGSCCTITMTQQICVSIPVCYGVTMGGGETTIACADNNCIGCGCCSAKGTSAVSAAGVLFFTPASCK